MTQEELKMKSYYRTQEIEDYLEMADSALEYIMKATRPGLCDADRYFYVGRICDFFYCPESALAAFNEAIRIDPNHVETLYELAEIDSWHGKHKEAIEKYKKLICLDPGNARAYMEIAQIYEYFLPDAMKAIEAFKEAIRCDPSHAAAHLHLGLVYLKIGDIKSAEEEREKLRLLGSHLANESYWTRNDKDLLSRINYNISPNKGGN
jgi:tetratricopeptide (TPR) repeat protein